MNRKILIKSVVTLGMIFLFATLLFGRGPENSGLSMSKTSDVLDPTRTLSNINNWSYWLYYDGRSGIDPDGNGGGIYPRATTNVIYEDGFVWGAIVDGNIRVGGQTYRIGTQPAVDRIYRIRSDWKKLLEDPTPLRQDAVEFYRTTNAAVTDQMLQDLAAQYAKDWKEWPVDAGAPYYDVNGNGIYDPQLDADGYPIPAEYDEDGNLVSGGDYPGIANADQVVWFKVNDQDSSRTVNLYGSDPIGLELQVTTWGYNQTESQLGQIIFKKYTLINISGKQLDSMYVAQWCDPDVGNYTDDVVGCDPALGVGFAYNGGETDNDFASLGLAPSAVGYDFFQGPMIDGQAGQDLNNNGVDDAEDYAVFNLKKVGPGKVNLPMTSFGYFSAGNTEWDDPDLGDYAGTLQWYNLLRGYITNDQVDNPTPFTHRATGEPTKFPLDGDPVTGEGDIDGDPGLGNFAPADRRMSLSTGPFVMAPGDTQEVVVAIIGGKSGKLGEGSRTQSVFDLKVNDEIAQFLYNTLFTQVPKPPTAPRVKVIPQETRITLDWSFDPTTVDETENKVEAGYEFEGYNVYQLPSAKSSLSDAKLVAVFDKVNNIKVIRETRFLPQYGTGVVVPVRYGNDNGVQRYITIEKDYLTGKPLYPGNTYYFAVTAYNYNPQSEVVKSLESSLNILTVTTQSAMPGIEDGSEPQDMVQVEHSSGSAEQANVEVKVIDPSRITGHDYEVYFEPWHYYMDVDGQWKRTNYPDSVGGALGKGADVSQSKITGIAYTSPTPGTRDLKFTLDLVSTDYSYSDGISLIFPPEIEINSAEPAIGNAYGISYDPIIDLDNNTVTWGSPDTSGDGGFSGGEVFTVNVNTPTLPLDVEYWVFDDGWGYYYLANYGLPPGVVIFAHDTCTITKESYAFKTVNMWGLKDLTEDKVVLEGQDRLYNDHTSEAPIVDGFQIIVGGSYQAPTDFSDAIHIAPDGTEESVADFGTQGVGIGSYAFYGWSDDGTARAVGTYGDGTTDLNLLIKDYEVRWTADYDTVDVNGLTVIKVKEGTGSMAYLFGARGYDLADHPLNPNPGSSDGFMVRVPFEVWNVEDGYQCNMLIYDRKQDPSDTSTPFYAFNPNDRMYTYFLISHYSEDIPTAQVIHDSLTWNVVWWSAPYEKGDKVYFKYPNPIILGSDKFTFSTKGLGESQSVENEKAAAEKVTVYPNPYYAGNSQELSDVEKFVTFYHLVPKTTIRIFNLAGEQVRKLVKDPNDNSQFLRWDLNNDNGLPVASGIYFAYVEQTLSDGSKVTKVLKVFIIQRAQMLKYF